MEKHFPKDAKIVVGCKSGGRSLQAATMLLASGYHDVVDQARGRSAGSTEPGWAQKGLPTSKEAPADHTFAGLGGKTR